MRRPARRYWGTPRNTAVRPVRPRGETLRGVARVVVRVVAACVVLWAVDRCLIWLTTSPGFAVEAVEVRGAVHADTDAIAKASSVLGENLFTLDLAEVRARVLENPWLRDASIHRSLPDAVRVDVVEKEPAALAEEGGRLVLLDETGAVIQAGVEVGRFRLPLVVVRDGGSVEASRSRAAATLAAVRVAVPEYFGRIRVLDATRDDRLTLRVDGHPPVYLAGPDSANELAGYLRGAEGYRALLGRVEYVDARWRDRLFVMPGGT